MPNFLIQEICSFVQPGDKEKIWAEWFGFPAMRMMGGRFPLPAKPGLGFELTEASLSKYPFGGSRPMARVFHQDGSGRRVVIDDVELAGRPFCGSDSLVAG